MKGRAPPRVVAGSRIDEELSCDVQLRFTADGNLTAELRRYLYVKTETKRSPAGDFRNITRVSGLASPVKTQSWLTLWVTPSDFVQKAEWQRAPGPEFPGTVETEVQRQVGQDRWQRLDYKSQGVTVYCYPRVVWRGRNRQGPGLPLRGTYRGPDYIGNREWVMIDAAWDLAPLRGR